MGETWQEGKRGGRCEGKSVFAEGFKKREEVVAKRSAVAER
jgi:hypothetical protein